MEPNFVNIVAHWLMEEFHCVVTVDKSRVIVYGHEDMNISIDGDKASLFIDSKHIITSTVYDPESFGILKKAVEEQILA